MSVNLLGVDVVWETAWGVLTGTRTLDQFDAHPVQAALIKNNYVAPFVAVVVYLLLCFVILPKIRWTKCPPWMKHAFALWNLILSIFSIAGTVVCVPYAVRTIYSRGLHYIVCSDDMMLSKTDKGAACLGAEGFFMTIFMLSKFPELCDTFFLVLMNKPVQFIHWYHHVTVLVYSWFAYAEATPAAVLFGTFNYTVHSVMYFYFATSGYTKALSFLRQPITSLQLAQMFLGLLTVVLSFIYNRNWLGDSGCSVSYVQTNFFWYCSALYGSYFALFALLYHDNYRRRKASKGAKSHEE